MSGSQQTDGIRSASVIIQDFQSLLMAEVPYGVIDPRNIRRVFDLVPGGRKDSQPLYWQFGQKMWPIDGAMRFEYMYTSPGYNQETLASLLIGRVQASEKVTTAHVGSSAPESEIKRVAMSFDKIANENMLNFAVSTKASLTGTSIFSPPEEQDTHVDICGLASDYNSLRALPYTWSEVAADPTKLDQLFYWPFHNLSYRVCKAMRISGDNGSLLIGYHGPGGN